MLISVRKIDCIDERSSIVFLCSSEMSLEKLPFSEKEKEYIANELKREDSLVSVMLERFAYRIYVVFPEKEKNPSKILEKARIEGSRITADCNARKNRKISVRGTEVDKKIVKSFLEGMLLGNYQFIKYFTDKEKKKNSLETIEVLHDNISSKEISQMMSVMEAVYYCRDFVNEPVCYLNAEKLAVEFMRIGREAGVKTEVLNQTKIEALKMGGLLSVNKGSVDPASFTIMEWNPKNKVNTNPIVLVGKGIVYDTGGMNLKPGDYMNDMKDDMAGAATVAGVIYAAAKNDLPVHIIALVPATDNRPGGNAFVSGDIVKMYDGTTVEVVNTDAEGRMILADALSYAEQYHPELVIDVATLTGAAQRAIGKYGVAAMQNNAENDMNQLKQAGDDVYERIAEFPFWDEYDELIKSEIADIKNAGGEYAGMITAGKFLSHFTNYPYIHLDIAGAAFYHKAENYYSAGGTGYGIRLLYRFIEMKSGTAEKK